MKAKVYVGFMGRSDSPDYWYWRLQIQGKSYYVASHFDYKDKGAARNAAEVAARRLDLTLIQ